MPRKIKTAQSQVLHDFMEIEDKAFHQRIRFYESHQQEVSLLQEKEAFLLKEGYADALFQVGAYHKHLDVVDDLIEETMAHNIRFFKGEDIFQGLLFRKAASLFQMERIMEASHILRELILINPAFRDPAFFLARCYRRQRPGWLAKARAASVGLFIATALIISLEMLVFEPFFPTWTSLVEGTRISTFFAGILCLTGGELYHYSECRNRVRQFVRFARRKKKWDSPS